MNVKPIKTDPDYRMALQEVENLMAAAPGSPKGEKLDLMATLIEAYEAKLRVDLNSQCDSFLLWNSVFLRGIHSHGTAATHLISS